jgi:lysophospholipase L1-like esterase
MRRFLAIVGSVLAVALGALFLTGSQAIAVHAEQHIIIGDSYASGYLLADTSKRWTSIVTASVGATEHNYAVPSAGYVNPGRDGQSTFPQQAARAVAAGVVPDVVWISGGINDSTIATGAQITAALGQTVSILWAAFPAAKIIVVSPMWFHTQPSDQLGTITTAVETTAPQGVTVLPDAAMLRFNHPELGFYDGHPNEAGHALIASWVEEQVYGSPATGQTYGRFIRQGTADARFGGSPNNLAEGTIPNARRGWWEIDGSAVLYGASPGFLFVQAGALREATRADTTASPLPYQSRHRFWHSGGDLHISIGYAPNSSTAVISNGSTDVSGTYLGK